MIMNDFVPAVTEPPEVRDVRPHVLRYRLAAEQAVTRLFEHINIEFKVLAFTRTLSRKHGRAQERRLWFGGYGFALFCAANDNWAQALRGPGVLGFLGTATGQPIPLPLGEYEDLLARCPEQIANSNH